LQPRRLSELARRASVIRQNFRNGRCKVIHAGTRYDDAVAPAVSFLRDAQELPAIILAELHVKMLTLNLQFFRLDNVIHHSWSRRLYGSRFTEGKENPRFFLHNFVGLSAIVSLSIRRWGGGSSSYPE
jgi:hypothetical protein